jgi:hypothetical protein
MGLIASKLLGAEEIEKLRKRLGLLRPTEMEAIARRYGEDVLRHAYGENLKIVLKYASKLLQNLSGKIVITSDHGELLGEEGYYGHMMWSNHFLLREVPWLDLKAERRTSESTVNAEKRRIKLIIKRMKQEGLSNKSRLK